MLRAKTESITWGLDEGGYFLKIRTSLARQITEAIKAEAMYVVEIKRHRKRRSLDQNSMYWSVLGQIAKALNISNNHAHNLMLRRYGAVETIDGKTISWYSRTRKRPHRGLTRPRATTSSRQVKSRSAQTETHIAPTSFCADRPPMIPPK